MTGTINLAGNKGEGKKNSTSICLMSLELRAESIRSVPDASYMIS